MKHEWTKVTCFLTPLAPCKREYCNRLEFLFWVFILQHCSIVFLGTDSLIHKVERMLPISAVVFYFLLSFHKQTNQHKQLHNDHQLISRAKKVRFFTISTINHQNKLITLLQTLRKHNNRYNFSRIWRTKLKKTNNVI